MSPSSRLLPFLRWFPLRGDNLKADLIAGVTVALVLIPQSMAYAQLVGLPAYYGLYAAFLPGIVAAMWGSSSQLATGPVAVVSLLTASILAPLAATGSESFIALTIMLALLVGVIQLALGAFKLGVVVNFLSHPVIVGFTNAAAIIIGLSQLNKLLGVSMGRSEHFIQDIWGVLQQVGETHWPTLAMGATAIAIMWGARRFAPKLPGVLIAVVMTTVVSWSTGFEHNSTAQIDQIVDPEVRRLATEYMQTDLRRGELEVQIGTKQAELKALEQAVKPNPQRALAIDYEVELFKLEIKDAENENRRRQRAIRKFIFEQVPGVAGEPGKLYLVGQLPPDAKSDGHRWRIKRIGKQDIKLVGGGEVVGTIPAGLPSFDLPKLSWSTISALFSGALVIALVGFMEAISIAKAMSARTKQRIDPNQELIGQGLANLVGCFSHAFPVSGSFSRSAVNLSAGAKTGMSLVFAGVIVLVTLLFLTPLLYHLPQAVLAAVIMMAVVGLINFKAIRHAWETHKHDGIAAIITFIATLAFAPHLDNGIMVGAGLAILLFLYRTMKPRVVILGRYHDGTLRDARLHKLPTSEHLAAMRFDGQLYFANVSYFEDALLEIAAKFPKAGHILVVGDGINQLDASGEETIQNMVKRLRENGVTLVFSGLKRQVLEMMRHTGLFDLIGEENIFATEDQAIAAICARLGDAVAGDPFCVLPTPLPDAALKREFAVP